MHHSFLFLPFDHRSTFVRDLLRYNGEVTLEVTDKIKELKTMIYESFLSVRNSFNSREDFYILIDEQFSSHLISRANKDTIPFALGIEKSGQQFFDFADGIRYKDHIRNIRPTYTKVLVRYHPKNVSENRQQRERLCELSRFCVSEGFKLLFELLVPPSQDDIQELGSEDAYYTSRRISYTTTALKEISAEVRADLWKLEGSNAKDWPEILAITGNTPVIVLGRGANIDVVKRWILEGAQFSQIQGFAVGRTVFFSPLREFIDGTITRNEAIERMRREYESLVRLWYDCRNKRNIKAHER